MTWPGTSEVLCTLGGSFAIGFTVASILYLMCRRILKEMRR